VRAARDARPRLVPFSHLRAPRFGALHLRSGSAEMLYNHAVGA